MVSAHPMTERKKQKTFFTLLGVVYALTVLASGMFFSPPRLQAEPDVGSNGAYAMHGDIRSSDTSPLNGPGLADVRIDTRTFLSACPTVLIRSDGNPFVLSTSMLTRNPVVRLINRTDGRQMAKIELAQGSLLGGVYAYLDSLDRLVMVDGNQDLLRIRAVSTKTLLGLRWELTVDERISLLSAVTDHCGGEGCDAVVSINAGADGAVWFVTQQALAGICSPGGDRIQTVTMADGERVDNSFSTTSDGRAAIVTNQALYLLDQADQGAPHVVWREEYDNGSARKPGQLSHGSGATPTFFGPETGEDYVMITDNADGCISLIVRHVKDGSLVCQKEIFTPGVNSGTENSAIGFGNTVIVASTYGYPYPELPEGAGPSEPESADFAGGMVRVDLLACDAGTEPCEPGRIIWENTVRSSAVPKLSRADSLIYTVERLSARNGDQTSILDSYAFTVIDLETGDVKAQTDMGSGFFSDTLQMAGNLGPGLVYWQGTISGVVRISP